MEKWEYLIGRIVRDQWQDSLGNRVRLDIENDRFSDLPKVLKSLGEEGWELVTTNQKHGHTESYIFKRAIS